MSPASVEVTPNNSGSPGSIASLALPAGNYLVFASVVFSNANNAFAQDNSRYIRCGFGWLGGLGNPTTDVNIGGLSSGWISVHDLVQLTASGSASLNCRTENGANDHSHVTTSKVTVSAIKLGSLN